MTENKTTRLYFIDNIRVFLISAIVLLHLAITYGAPGGWYYYEVQLENLDVFSLALYSLFNATVQAFSLGIFFMISGYFTVVSYDRKSAGQFIKDKFLRLGIPLLVYIVIINPVLVYIIRIFAKGEDISYADFIVNYVRTTTSIGVGPLWFVEAVLIFSVVYVLWRLFTKNIFALSQFAWNFPGNTVIAIFALFVGLMSFTVRIWFPVFSVFELLNFQFPHFSQYVCFFIAGIWAYRGKWFHTIPDKAGALWVKTAALLIIIFPVIIIMSGFHNGDMSLFGGINWKSFVYSLWEQFVCASMAVSLPYIFQRKFNYNGKLAQALSASTYTVYIIHASVIIVLSLVLKNIKMYPLLKFILVAPFAVSLSFLFANFIRKLPYARKIL